MKKKRVPKNDPLPPLPTELWWGRSNDTPRSKLIQEQSWPKIVSRKLAQGESHPPGRPWYETAPERLLDRIESETLYLWLQLAPRVLQSAHQEDNHLAIDPWRILVAVGRLIARRDAYHSVTVVLEAITSCTGETVLAQRAKARDYQKIFHRLENLRLALALHNEAMSDLSDAGTDLGECMRKMTEALAWFVVEGYNLGSVARLAGVRHLEDEVSQGRKHKKRGARKSLEKRRALRSSAQQRAFELAKERASKGSDLVSLVTAALALEGFTHKYRGTDVPYSDRTVRGWLSTHAGKNSEMK